MTTDEQSSGAEDGMAAAGRLLDIATRSADELLEAANAEAVSIRAAAHADAQRVRAELEHTKIAQEAELDEHRTTVLAQLAERQASLEAEVVRLESLEQEIRARTLGFVTEQLEQLDLLGSEPKPQLERKSTA